MEHYACVNREELRRALEREGVRPTAYSLNPDRLSDDVYCLTIVAGGWSVWFAERGKKNAETDRCRFGTCQVVGQASTKMA
jgi:hypothetical protein